MNQPTANQQGDKQSHPNQQPSNLQKQSSDQRVSPPHPPAANVPSQAQIYDNLRRIGELEDKKQSIQNEIDSRTAKLHGARQHVAADSLLYKMLTLALAEADLAVSTTKPGSQARAPKSTSARRAKKGSAQRSTNKKTATRKSKPKAKPRSSKKKRR
jgi:hypothetical protein